MSSETVVLLHGQGRTRASLLVLRQRLRGAGFRVASTRLDGMRDWVLVHHTHA
jgi:hypothetical protein